MMDWNWTAIKTFIREKAQDQTVVVWTASALGLLFAVILVSWPLGARHARVSKMLAARMRNIEAAHAGGLELGPQGLARLQARVTSFQDGFIRESQLPALLNDLSSQAEKSRIRVLDVHSEPAAPIEDEAGHALEIEGQKFMRFPVTARLEGDVKSLAEFFMSLVQSLPAVFVVDSLRLEKASANSSVLSCEMKMSFFQFFKRGAPHPAAASEHAAEFSFVASVLESEKRAGEQETAWDREWGRDPFMPEEFGSVAPSGSISLTGIIWDAKMPVAMINEKVMRVGDSVGGYRIVRIRPNAVVFSSSEGGEFELPLFKKTE